MSDNSNIYLYEIRYLLVEGGCEKLFEKGVAFGVEDDGCANGDSTGDGDVEGCIDWKAGSETTL